MEGGDGGGSPLSRHRGLIFQNSAAEKDAPKFWPEFLIFCSVVDRMACRWCFCLSVCLRRYLKGIVSKEEEKETEEGNVCMWNSNRQLQLDQKGRPAVRRASPLFFFFPLQSGFLKGVGCKGKGFKTQRHHHRQETLMCKGK